MGAGAAGFATLVVPMAAYFLWLGNFQNFLQEYFIITFQSIDNILGSNDRGEFFRREDLAYMAVAFAGAVTALFALKKARWFPPVAVAWFTLCLSKYCRTYYYIPVNVLMVFTIYGAMRCFDRDFGGKRYVFIALLAAALGYFGYTNAWTYRHDYFYGRKLTIQRERPQQYIKLLSGELHPRVLYWWCGDHGYGIEAEDLPACKYWALQAGCTQEMIDNQDQAVKNKLADYVFVETHDTFHQKILVSEGYTRCNQPEFGPYRVYSYRAEEEEDLGYVEDED